jgi:CRISPR-associated endonuclease/helicase Cas3
MKISLQPLYSRLADSSAEAGISWHQQATWEALSDPAIDAVINIAATGDGKSYAAFGAFPNGGVMALYPTNELVRDQQRQLDHYQQQWRVQRVTGLDLERWATAAKQSKAETLLDLSDAEVLLTNPDLFYYLHQGNYLKDFLKQGSDHHHLGLWQQIDQQFQAIIFDEFHLYQPSQISGVLNTLLLMRSVGMRHKLVFLSATLYQYLMEALELAGLNVALIDPASISGYSCVGDKGWRQINQLTALNLIPQDRAYDWILENQKAILQFWLDHRGSKGAIILNSIASAKRVKRSLSKLFSEYGLSVSENTGFTDYEEVQKAISADLIVGTSTLDVGIDFKINWLLFEGHDAPSFVQRLGRIGRHPGFDCYQAIAFVPRYVYERIESHKVESIGRPEFMVMVFREHRQINQFEGYYRQWAPIQSFCIGRQLRHRDLEGRYLGALRQYQRQAEALWGESFKDCADRLKLAKAEAEAIGLRKGNPIGFEALSFRGTNSFQCAVISPSGNYTTYNLPTLLSNYNFSFVDPKAFPEWFSAAQHCAFHIQVHELLERRQYWRFFLSENIAENIAGRLVTLAGLTTINAINGSQINNLLRNRAIVAFICLHPADSLRQRLKLPLHFPLYDLQTRVIERDCVYSIAFDQAALMLDSVLGFREYQA